MSVLEKWEVTMLIARLLASVLLLSAALPLGAQQALSVRAAVDMAWDQDPWLSGSRLRQAALADDAVAAGALPDPVVSLGVANLPIDTFDFNQEAMTQFKVGVSQMLPRGDSLTLSRQRLQVLGNQQQVQRSERRAQLALAVSGLWLSAWQAQQSMELIRQDRVLFVDLVEIVQSSYASGLVQARQQDVIRARLELTRLDDRLAVLQERYDSAVGELGRWLDAESRNVVIAAPAPALSLLMEPPREGTGAADVEWLSTALSRHPAIGDIDQNIAVSELAIDLARQKYKPQWGINAGYGYREDGPHGVDRPDFFSVGVSFDLPLFTSSRQDRELRAAEARAGASRTDKALMLRQLRAGFDAQWARLAQLDRRLALYNEQLLVQLHDQAEVALSAYTADEGDFSEAVRARIDELNARVEALALTVERQRAIAQLNYYLAGLDERVAQNDLVDESVDDLVDDTADKEVTQ